MRPPLKYAILVVALSGAVVPAMAAGDGHDRHARGPDAQVDVPGWRLPAMRVLPPVGYTARPLPGGAPVHGGYRSPPSRWVRGVHYDNGGHAPTLIVRDYRAHGLRPPPPGYYWRGDARGTYLLVAQANGLVAGVVRPGG